MSFGEHKKKIVVLGGGFAGIAFIIQFRKLLGETVSITLIDKSDSHKILSLLHKYAFSNSPKWKIPFNILAKRFNFRFIQTDLQFTEDNIKTWSLTKIININDEQISFDALLISTGAKSRKITSSTLENSNSYWTTENILQQNFYQDFKSCLGSLKNISELKIAFVGAGATSLQFLFSLYHYLQRKKINSKFILLDREEKLFNNLSLEFHHYITKSLQKKKISYLKNYNLKKISLAKSASGIELVNSKKSSVIADFVFSFTGVEENPFLFKADLHGRLILNKNIIPGIYVAGDCSFFNSNGLNAKSAQAAVRKGKICAENVNLFLQDKSQKEYNYKEIGLVLDMGPGNSIAWLAQKNIVLKAIPAVIIKEALEKQYELFLNGYDTYIPSSIIKLF